MISYKNTAYYIQHLFSEPQNKLCLIPNPQSDLNTVITVTTNVLAPDSTLANSKHSIIGRIWYMLLQHFINQMVISIKFNKI